MYKQGLYVYINVGKLIIVYLVGGSAKESICGTNHIFYASYYYYGNKYKKTLPAPTKPLTPPMTLQNVTPLSSRIRLSPSPAGKWWSWPLVFPQQAFYPFWLKVSRNVTWLTNSDLLTNITLNAHAKRFGWGDNKPPKNVANHLD